MSTNNLPPPSADGQPFVRVEGLHKVFQMGQTAVSALAGVDLEIEQGSFMVVMGPSGSGKSTLLTLIGGLDRPTAGTIEVGGQPLNTLNENELARFRRQQVGFVFQSFNLVPSMTALENVALPMRFAGVSRRQRRQRAGELLRRVGLSDRAYHRPAELSGGQQQRVAIARALANEPHLILADEPTGNLDTAGGMAIMQMLSDLHREGRTVLVVSHDLRIRAFATRIVYLLDGRVANESDYIAASNLKTGEGSPT
jgi:putative ABC transport system ATP-binding protein